MEPQTKIEEIQPEVRSTVISQVTSVEEELPLVLASSNPQVVRVTLEAQGTLLYNAQK